MGSNEKSSHSPQEGQPFIQNVTTSTQIPSRPAQQSYAAAQAGYVPVHGGFAPAPGGYNPPPGAYGPGPGGYSPAPGGYGSAPGGYNPPPGAYGPGPGGYGPAPGGYGSAPGSYVQPQGYPPPQGVAYIPGGPITTQPMGQPNVPQIQWMTKPQNVLNCPPGLEYLSTIDHLLVQQQIDYLEMVTNFEMENRYVILNKLGQQIYFAQEVSDVANRNLQGSSREFEMKITDNFGNLIINLRRPFACAGCCCTCCCPCCLDSMEVFAPPGTLVGRIEQEWACFSSEFIIKNASGEVILRISGPCCTASCCSDVEFKVMSANGNNEVGKICKQWSGYAKETYSNADNFGISFPMDLDVGMKAVMLGACFLIDFLYYEEKPNQNQNRGQLGMHHQRGF